MLAEFTFADLMWSLLWFGLLGLGIGTWIWFLVRLIRRRDWWWLFGLIGVPLLAFGMVVPITYFVLSSRQTKKASTPPPPPPPPPSG